MIEVRFQIPGKTQDVNVIAIPRKDEIVKIWSNRYRVMHVIHDLNDHFSEIIWISLYPEK